jgi:DNA-binding SARP family transcriptional activator
VLLARLTADPTIDTFYYALDTDDINLRNFLTRVTHDLSNQHPMFGRHLNLLPRVAQEDPYKYFDLVLDTFIKELVELSDNTFYFIFDEYDRSDSADDIQRFIERLSHCLPLRCKILLNSRTLPRMPWVSMIAKGHAVILKDEHLLREDFYSNRNREGANLGVYSMGPGYVMLDDLLVEDWEGHLPRLLLFFTLDRPVVTRNEICEAFWPDLDDDQAVNVFHVTKRRLHKALELDTLMHDGTYYRMNPDIPFYFDMFDFVETLMVGRHGNPDNPFDVWQRVIKLYRGPFLQGHNEQWIQERREAFRFGYIEALDKVAEIWQERGNDELALRTYRKAVDTDFSRADMHYKTMKLYAEMGRRAEAVAHYNNVKSWTKAEKQPLAEELQQLYAEITI